MDRWEWLINNTKLDILEFDISVFDTYHSGERVLPFYVMSYIKEGAAKALINGKVYKTPSGTLLLIPAMVKHVHYLPDDAESTTFLWWHFTLTIDGGVDLMRLIDLPYTVTIENTSFFESIFYQYAELYRKGKSIPNLIMKRAKGLEVMAHLFSSILDSVPERDRLLPNIPDAFFKILMDIVEHPEKRVSLGEISDKYHMNATYVSNRFKKFFGVTPIQMQHNILIDRANSLLIGGEMSIRDIAEALGFVDVASFSRFYSKRVGCAPREYRKR